MNLLWLFDTCGYIVGPAILLAGLCAVAVCLWASRRVSSRRARRVALAAAVSPLAVGACGAVFGLVLCWVSHIPNTPWLAMGKVCLAGLVVAALPLGWALFLLRPRASSAATVSGE